MPSIFSARWKTTRVPDGIRVVWRALNWTEFQNLFARYSDQSLTVLGPMDLYLEVYKAVVVAGPPIEEVTAGIVSFIGRQQLVGNPYTGQIWPVVNKLIEKRAWIASSYLEVTRSVVAATFHIPFETINKWDPDTLFEYFVRAEQAVGNQWNPADPTAQQQRQQELHAPQPRNAREAAFLRAKERRRRADLEEQGQPEQGVPEPPVNETFSWGR